MSAMRVVRGPDWKWGDQDGGEGMMGTADIGDRNDGWTTVTWDKGHKNPYRTGADNGHDLYIFDMATLGVKHPGVSCDFCKAMDILGYRWKCAVCERYDLCNTCYMSDKHEIEHAFFRISSPDSARSHKFVRKGSSKFQAVGLFKGAVVVRGSNWNYGNQDGNKPGRILECDVEGPGIFTVRWEATEHTNIYQAGHGGKSDIQCLTVANGPMYYKDHLAILGTKKTNKAPSEKEELFMNLSLLGEAFKEMKLIKSDTPEDEQVDDGATHFLNEGKNRATPLQLPSLPSKPGVCPNFDLAGRVLLSLKLNEKCFETEFDRCYCSCCYNKSGDSPFCKQGEPPERYATPVDWAYFGLTISPAAIALGVLDKWHTAYYRSTIDKLATILDSGRLITPEVDDRDQLEVAAASSGSHCKSEGIDAQIIVSPSIIYSVKGEVATTSCQDLLDGNNCRARFVFQLRIKPRSYQQRRPAKQAPINTTPIDPNFDNDKLEWAVSSNSMVALVGLLIKVEQN